MRKTLVLVLAVTVQVVLPAGSCAVEPELPTVDKLIEQLGSLNFADREQATRMLKNRGSEALPALERALSHRDSEVRSRVQLLIPIIKATAALQPRRVTLGADPLTLADTLKKLQHQTGFPLSADPEDDNRHFTLEMNDIPFWVAVEQIRTCVGRHVGVEVLEKDIRLKPGLGSPFVAVDGPFRLEVAKFHEDRDIDFTQPGQGNDLGRHDHLLTLTFAVLAEPRFIILAVDPGEVETAVDAAGKTMPAAEAPEKRSLNDWIRLRDVIRQDFQHTGEIRLRRASSQAKSIKKLSGTIPVSVVVERKRVIVTNNVLWSKGLDFKIGDETLQITGVEEDDGSYHIDVAVPPDRGKLPSRWLDRVHLEDSSGNRYRRTGSGTRSSTIGGVQEHTIMLTCRKPDGAKIGPATTLVVEDWVVLRHPIRFHFEDVPLP